MGHAATPKIKHLPAKLLAIRQALGLSQLQMGQRINFAGSRLSEFERGRRQPHVLVLLAYARAARIPLESIVDDEIELKF